MNVLIIGGSGLVGGNIYTVFSDKRSDEVVLATHLTYPTIYTRFFDTFAPFDKEIADGNWDVIIHTGALTNVDKCETEKELSYKLTVDSTKVLLDFAVEKKAKFVYISTDYIFDGTSGPYKEDDTPNPINIYGEHKLKAENLVLKYENSLIIRITNVYGLEERKKNFVSRIINELKIKGSLEITAPMDQFATPINALDIAKSIYLLVNDDKKGIYHLASTDFLSRVQLLKRINLYFSDKISIRSVKTIQANQTAKRPLLGGLIASKFVNEYPDFIFSNLDDYLKLLK